MLAELLKCFLTGFAGFASVALLGWLTWLAWPWSGYAWAGLLLCGFCVGLGASMRSPSCGLPPR
jgi:hypothetical protein